MFHRNVIVILCTTFLLILIGCNQPANEKISDIIDLPSEESVPPLGEDGLNELQDCANVLGNVGRYNCLKRIIVEEDKTNDETICLKLIHPQVTSIFQGNCLQLFAIKEGDIKICNNLPTSDIERSSCVYAAAWRTKNPQYCAEIDYNSGLKDLCYSNYVTKLNLNKETVDPSVCDNVINDNERENCRRAADQQHY